ncbi:uncharacterized protein LOC110093867 [Dendrobium catenatum]|uniref:uncharacterized protein LOC110093867 n=1 Tax=Dendrobium catenatum TaxID=906689 RepID=UPI00109F082D|nr:uncharacterized protein LOC110093867 [Dendrobium catenatum]
MEEGGVVASMLPGPVVVPSVLVAPDGIVDVDSAVHGLPAPSNCHVSPVTVSSVLPSLGGSPVGLVELVTVLDSSINVGLVRSSPVLSPAAYSPTAYAPVDCPEVDGELVVYGGVDGVVSPNVAPATVVVFDINYCVNINDSPSYVDDGVLAIGKSAYSVDNGEETLAIVGEDNMSVSSGEDDTILETGSLDKFVSQRKRKSEKK